MNIDRVHVNTFLGVIICLEICWKPDIKHVQFSRCDNMPQDLLETSHKTCTILTVTKYLSPVCGKARAGSQLTVHSVLLTGLTYINYRVEVWGNTFTLQKES